MAQPALDRVVDRILRYADIEDDVPIELLTFQLGGQRGNLLLCLIIVDNAVHLHAEPGKPFLELRKRLILGYVLAGK